MHYYGTYAMARSAGIPNAVARTIAACAQFVDDNVASSHVDFENGARINAVATAHHACDVDNLSPDDQRQIWVPFHFLPGNIGNSYTERLKCRMDSPIAREMCEHHLHRAPRDFAPALMGIAAHVYADTFSHYGFSGVSSRGNKVEQDSFKFHEEIHSDHPLKPDMRDYITRKAKAFFSSPNNGFSMENIKAWLAETLSGSLGHGSVATYPDRPYLIWRFTYENPDAVANPSTRNNPETFLLGCQALYRLFKRFGEHYPNAPSHPDFDHIRDTVAEILQLQGPKAERIAKWQEAAEQGRLWPTKESIPPYPGEQWNHDWQAQRPDYNAVLQSPIWHFYQAAAIHRTYVLRDLLPQYDLVVN